MNYRSAVILCGGKGTRLGELGKKLPKTLENRLLLGGEISPNLVTLT